MKFVKKSIVLSLAVASCSLDVPFAMAAESVSATKNDTKASETTDKELSSATIEDAVKASVAQNEATSTATEASETTTETTSKLSESTVSQTEKQSEETEETEPTTRSKRQTETPSDQPEIPTYANQAIKADTRLAMTADQKKVVDWAKKQIGKPYVWGGKGPNSFDCSGLVQYVYKNAVNMTLSAPTTSQETKGKSVSLNQLQVGDVLFWGAKGSSYHNAIYIGNNQFIHAPQPGEKVKVLDMQYFKPDFARRVLKEETGKPNLSNYYTTASKEVVLKKDDYLYSSTTFNTANRKKTLKKNAIVKVTGIQYSADGYPRFKVSGGYLSTNKSITLKVTPKIANYHTTAPKEVVLKKDDYLYSGTTFNTANRKKTLKKNTVIKVTGIDYSADGYPRFKVSGGYVSTNKSITLKAPSNLGNYHTTAPKEVVLKKDDFLYSSTTFNTANRKKTLKKNTVVKVTGIDYSVDGYPRFKVSGGYISTNKSITLKAPSNLGNYHTTAPKEVVLKKDDFLYSSTTFNTANRKKTLKKNTIVKVTGIDYSGDGYPRFKVSGGYVSTNKSITLKVTPNIANYYTTPFKEISLKKDDFLYSSTTFNTANRKRTLKKNTVVKVTGIEYSTDGYPRFKVSDGYVSTNKTIVQEKTADVKKGQATAYSATGNLTATGTVPKVRRTIAVDPKVIPLGSSVRVTVPGAPSYSGVYVAEDTGGAVKGNIIDIFVGSYGEAIRFGRQSITFTVL